MLINNIYILNNIVLNNITLKKIKLMYNCNLGTLGDNSEFPLSHKNNHMFND